VIHHQRLIPCQPRVKGYQGRQYLLPNALAGLLPLGVVTNGKFGCGAKGAAAYSLRYTSLSAFTNAGEGIRTLYQCSADAMTSGRDRARGPYPADG
jgi:hypothetical protein